MYRRHDESWSWIYHIYPISYILHLPVAGSFNDLFQIYRYIWFRKKIPSISNRNKCKSFFCLFLLNVLKIIFVFFIEGYMDFDFIHFWMDTLYACIPMANIFRFKFNTTSSFISRSYFRQNGSSLDTFGFRIWKWIWVKRKKIIISQISLK